MSRLFILSYCLVITLLVLFSYLFIDQNFFHLGNFYTGFATTNRQIVSIIYFLFVLILFVFYFFFLRERYISNFLIGSIIFISLFSYSPFLSADIFNYLTSAKVLFSYNENPYIIMPIEFIGDPNLLFTHAANKIALYGPLWVVLSGIPYLLGFGNVLLILLNFKILVILFYLGTIWVIHKLTKSKFSVLLFALNPLIIIETLIGNHNDIIMMFFALFSFFLLTKKKIVWAASFLAGSILIKYATIFLLPVFLFAVYQIVKNEKVNWNRIYFYCALSMTTIFLLSSLRVEIYPWYAIWFLVFSFIIAKKKLLLYISLAFSFGLLLRYIPFMLLGTHFGISPMLKTVVTFSPVLLVLLYAYFKKSFR